MTDPFSDDYTPATDEKDTDTMTAPATEQAAGEISLTFKGDGNYYSPWIVLRGPDAATVNDLLDEELQELMRNSTKYAKAHYTLAQGIKGDAPATSGGGGGGGRQAPSAQDHPDGKKEFCEHGEMRFKSGVAGPTAKNPGKPYSMFVCTESDRDKQCRPKNA